MAVNFKKSIANLINVDVLPINGLNVLSVLNKDKLVLSKNALVYLQDRFAV